MTQAVNPDSLAGGFFNEASESQQLQKISQERAKYLEDPNDTILVGPNGSFARLVDVIDHDYVAENQTVIFSDLSRWLKVPLRDGAMLCFPAKDDARTYGRERSGEYRRVAWDEFREDCPHPLTTHQGPGGEYVCVYDLICMEMPPEVVKRKHRWPQQGARLRTARGIPFKNMQGQVEDFAGAGMVRTEMDIKTDDGSVVHME